jgi:iron(III) transport system ATP-binding protein
VANFVGEMNFFSGHIKANQIFESGALKLDYSLSAPLDETMPVQVAIRPEDIRLRLNGDRHNVISGMVLDLEFMGSKVRSRLAITDHDMPIIADVSMNEMSELQLSAGQEVELQLPKDRLHLFSELAQ